MKTATPSYVSLSSSADGQMAYGHVHDEQTSTNIVTHLKSRYDGALKLGFIRCTYSERSYDIITPTNTEALPSIDGFEKNDGILTDALITTDPQTVLALPVADCIAMVLLDPIQQVLALAHLGWQASADNLAEKTVEKMIAEYKCSAQDIVAYLPPHISSDAYAFPAPINQQSIPAWKPYLKEEKGLIHIDLTGFNTAALQRAGLKMENILVDKRDTADPSSDFASNFMHNKDTHTDGSAPRFLVSCRIPSIRN